MKTFSKNLNIDNDTKKALLKTLSDTGDDWITSSIMELSNSYSSKRITFQDIMDKIDSILYGEAGGDATLTMLQSAEDFKKGFSTTYLDVTKGLNTLDL